MFVIHSFEPSFIRQTFQTFKRAQNWLIWTTNPLFTPAQLQFLPYRLSSKMLYSLSKLLKKTKPKICCQQSTNMVSANEPLVWLLFQPKNRGQHFYETITKHLSWKFKQKLEVCWPTTMLGFLKNAFLLFKLLKIFPTSPPNFSKHVQLHSTTTKTMSCPLKIDAKTAGAQGKFLSARAHRLLSASLLSFPLFPIQNKSNWLWIFGLGLGGGWDRLIWKVGLG